MLIALHKNATTEPAIRAAVQEAQGHNYGPARRFHVCPDTLQGGYQTAQRLHLPQVADQKAKRYPAPYRGLRQRALRPGIWCQSVHRPPDFTGSTQQGFSIQLTAPMKAPGSRGKQMGFE